MAEQSASSNHSAGGGSHIGAIVGWGSMAIATIVFIWFIMTQLAVGWEERGDEALALVKKWKGPGMSYNLSDQAIAVGNDARAKGRFIGQFSWAATQEEGPLYKVELIWKEDSVTKKATWEVNLQDSTVTAKGADAEAFMKPVG